MKIRFIDLITPDDKDRYGGRRHSLQMQDNGTLRTVGNIPHGHAWQPNSRNDRDKLVAFLKTIQYEDKPLDHTDIGTILAALRYYQRQGFGDFRRRPSDIHEIAMGHPLITSSLDDDGIDDLCERLNCSDDSDTKSGA